MILCFSGTGNSRYVADRIARLTDDAVTDMNGLIRQGNMACICRCPKAAIEYGKKSVGKPRYHCGTQS